MATASKPTAITSGNLWTLSFKNRMGKQASLIVADNREQATAIARLWCERQSAADFVGRGTTFLGLAPAVVAGPWTLTESTQPEADETEAVAAVAGADR